MAAQPIKGRIAPTPSGFLHLGNLASFVLTWILVRKENGSLLLRIDDIDSERLRDTYLQDIFDTLAFVGLSIDEGPSNVKDFKQHWSQHQRLAQYHAFIASLIATGQVYACTCSRRTIQATSIDGKYPGHCRHKNLSLNTAGAALRIAIPAGTIVKFTDEWLGEQTIDLASVMGDFVIRGKNGRPAYQVASVCDDLNFQINYVVRGIDLLPSTAAQLYLSEIAGRQAFKEIRWLHHPLLKDDSENKLSKSEGAKAITTMRSHGMNAEDIIQQIARLFWKELDTSAIHSLQEMLQLAKQHSPKW